jgi:hypothetical protein
MPGLLLHVGATVACTHFAPAQTTPTQPRVLVSGMPVATTANVWLVTGCPFTVPPGKPQPCVTVRWLSPAVRVLVEGLPPIVQAGIGTGEGICQSAEQIPQGPPLVAAIQPRVTAI